MMKHRSAILAVVSVVTLASAPGKLYAEELKGASLAGMSRLGAVIVTVSSDTVSEAEVRQAVESRLVEAKIAVDGAPGPELLVSVSAERNKSETGSCQFGSFRVTVGLREAVMLDRAPKQGAVSAITWRAGRTIKAFTTAAPRLAIMDALEDSLSSFLGSVASDSQQAAHERDEP